jgi:hypothetical protein
MQKTRLSDGLLATLALGAAVLCLVGAALDLNANAADQPSGALLPIRVAVLLVLGVASALAAWRLWTGRTRPPARDQSTAPLFGRGAGPPPFTRSRLLPLLAVVPIVAILAVAADRLVLAPPAEENPGTGTEIAEAPASPEPPPLASEPVVPPAAANPAPPASAESPPVEVAPTPPADLAAPPPDLAAPPPPAAEAPPAPAAPRPPEVALAPPAAPPETVAPPPAAPPEVETLPKGHRDAVVWLDVSPDGKTLVSASTDRTIKLWDLADRRWLRDLGAHKDMARSALFLPGGAEVLTGGDDGEIVLRSVADGAVLHVFSSSDHSGANKLAVSLDGKRAVSVHEAGTVIVWNLEEKSALHVLKGHDWPIVSVAVSPDGTLALTGDISGTLKLWDIAAGRLKRSWLGHERGTYGAVFTPDGHHVVTGSGDYTIKLWDLDSGQEVRRLSGHFGTVYALALSQDGERLLSASLDGTARLWDLATGREIAQLTGHNGPVYAVAFGPDGTLITGGIDRTIRIWRADGGEQLAMFPGAAE